MVCRILAFVLSFEALFGLDCTILHYTTLHRMGVSKNQGTPKSRAVILRTATKRTPKLYKKHEYPLTRTSSEPALYQPHSHLKEPCNSPFQGPPICSIS